MSGRHRRAVVYEPNPVNPYGAEVARILADVVDDVRLVVRRGVRPRTTGRVTTHALLEAGGGGALIGRLVARLLGPVLVAVSAGRDPLVVVWSRDLWDAALFAARASIGLPVLVVDHNPVRKRRRAGAAGLGERLLRSRATVVVAHSAHLAEATRRSTRRPVVVAPHPAYTATVGSAPARGPRSPGRTRVAVIGGFRRDKGLQHFVTVADRSGGGWDLVVLGPDRLPDELIAGLVRLDVRPVHPSTTPLTDDALVRGLQDADVVLAPYTEVTESGSVILALTVGVPVLGLDGPGLRRLIDDESRAGTPEALGRLLEAFVRDPWPTTRIGGAGLDAASTAGWRDALRIAEARRRP